MKTELYCGQRHRLPLHLPDQMVLEDCRFRGSEPLDDPSAAVAAALVEPLDFPPLTRAIIPSDHVALAVDRGVPHAPAVVAGIVRTLLEGGVTPENVHIVCASEMDGATAGRLTEQVAAEIQPRIAIEQHQGADPTGLAYLAASKEAKPVYFNRTLFDADVVVPIAAMRLESSLGYAGVHSGLFPTFSDDDTKLRFCVASSRDWQAHQQRCRDEADEAAWLLGVQLTVQIVPGPGESVLHVLAGQSHRVREEGKRLCETAWLYEVSRPADLVVATIEGGPDQQTWENFARALFAASRIVREGGSIVICTQLDDRPGPALQQLAGGADREAIVRQLRREPAADTWSASLLLETLERNQVYLLSRLDEDTVESLGVGCVSKAEEISRLGRQHRSCVLISNAQYAIVQEAGPPTDFEPPLG